MINKEQMKLVHELREQGVEWQTIYDTVEGMTDNDRKLYTGWLMGIQDADETNVLQQAKTLHAIRKARKILTVERSIVHQQLNYNVARELMDDQMREAILAQRHPINRRYRKQVPFTQPDEASIFTIADYHHSGDVAKLEEDFWKIGTLIIEEIVKNGLDHIYLVEMGDLVEGATLRNSQLMKIKAGIVTQIIQASKAYVTLIERLLEHVSITFITLESSNHTQIRNLGTKQNDIVEEDMMRIFTEYISLAFEQENDFEMISDQDVTMDILGYKFFFGHGHLVKGPSNMGKYIADLQADRNVLLDYSFFGHFHHGESVDLHSAGTYDKKAFLVPTADTGGQSDYEKKFNLSSMPAVGYYSFNSEDGHTMTKKLLIKDRY